jgi:hypothetical protein
MSRVCSDWGTLDEWECEEVEAMLEGRGGTGGGLGDGACPCGSGVVPRREVVAYGEGLGDA